MIRIQKFNMIVFLVLALIIAGAVTIAYGERMGERMGVGMHSPESQEQINVALEAGDYDAWVAATNGMPGMGLELITQDNFDTYVAMHKAKKEGNLELATQLREELGLPPKKAGMKHGGMGGMGKGHHMMTSEGMEKMRQNMEAIHQAMETQDYAAYTQLVATAEFIPMHMKDLSEEDFKLMGEMHKAKQAGDFAKVAELKKELGIEGGCMMIN